MSNLPAYLTGRPTRNLAEKALVNLGAGSPPYVSIMGNKFTLIDAAGAEEPVATWDAKLGPYLDCCIADIGDHMSKIFWSKTFDPNASAYTPPDCWSDNGVGPSRNAVTPQAPTCAVCPNSAWGSKVSAVSGKGVKACSDFQKLALVLPGGPGEAPDDVTFVLRVPPNSLGHLRGYLAKFVGQQVQVDNVVTRIHFTAGAIGQLEFNAVSFVDEPTFNRVQALVAAKATDSLVGRTDLPREVLGAGPMPSLPGRDPALDEPKQAQTPLQVAAQAAHTIPDPPAQSFVSNPPPAAAQAPVQAALPLPQQAEAAKPRRGRPPRQQAAEAPAAPAQQANGPASAASFGIAQPAAPSAELLATLDNIFGPK